MRIKVFRLFVIASMLAFVVSVSAQQGPSESVEELTAAVHKLEAIDRDPATRPEIREINRGFLMEKRARLLSLLLEKKQSRREYLSTAMSALNTDQIVAVEQDISDLQTQIKALQSALPANQEAPQNGTDGVPNSGVTSTAPNSSGTTSNQPSRPLVNTSIPTSTPVTPTNSTGTGQATSTTTSVQLTPTTVRSQYESRLAGIAENVRNAKATDPKATIRIQDSFFLFALALIAPKVEETQPAAIADLTAKAENMKTDKQTGANQGSTGTTSLVTKASIPAAFGFAVENGALTRTDNKTIITFSGTPVGIIEALAKKGFIEGYQKDDGFDRFLRNFSFRLNFDTSRGSTPGTFTGRQQLAGYSLRYKLVDQRDPRDKKYTQQWAALMAGEGLRVTQLLFRFFSDIYRTPTPAFTAWRTETENSVANAAPADVEGVLSRQLDKLRTIDLGAPVSDLMASFGKEFDSLLKSRDNILNQVNAGWASTIEYNNERRVGLPSLTNINFVAEKGAYKGSLDLTANASVTFLNSTLTGSTTRRLRDYSFSGQLDVPIGNIVSTGKFFLSFAGQFERLPTDEKASGVVVAAKGNIRVGQVKLTIPIRGTAFKIPLSISFANRTELIKEKHVRGNFGLTFDLDSILAKFNPFSQK